MWRWSRSVWPPERERSKERDHGEVFYEESLAAGLRGGDLLWPVPGRAVGDRPDALPVPGERESFDHAGRQGGGGLEAHRAAVHEGRVLPAPTLGRVV